MAALALACGCSRGNALEGACAADRDCPPRSHCVRGTGVCVRFLTPLDVDGGPNDGAAGD